MALSRWLSNHTSRAAAKRGRGLVALAATLWVATASRDGRGQGIAPADLDEPVAGPVDPRAQSAPPREVTVGSAQARPDVPARTPDRFAVLGFENRSGVRVLDWAVAGVPFSMGEKIERVIGLVPTYGPWVVPEGLVVAESPEAVASLANARDARWVLTGWVTRPNWQLRLHTTLWQRDATTGAVSIAAEHDVTGPIPETHALVGASLVALAAAAGWKLPHGGAAILAASPSQDIYGFTLLGRGLGHWLGSFGPVDAKAAVKDLTRSVFIDPFMVEGQRLVGELWTRDPDPKIAARAAGKFNYAVDLAPGYAPALRAAAERARQTGKGDIALLLYDRLVRARPWDLDARVGLGEALWQTGDAEGALSELSRVVERRPNDLGARRLLALIHGARGDIARLASELEAVTRLAPADLDTVVDLGAAYAELGRLDEATAAFERVAAARSADSTAQKRVADMYRRRGDVGAAVAWYGKVAALAPDDPRPVFLIGATHFDAGHIEEARRWFVRAQKFEKWLGQTYVLIGACAWLGGKIDESLWYWRNAVRKRPRSGVARYDLALAASAKGMTELALSQLDIFDEIVPGDAGSAYLRGVALTRAGDRVRARAAFTLALRRDSRHEDARWNLGVLARSGDDLRWEGKPRLDLPFGDREAFRAAIDRFATTDARMTSLRTLFQLDVTGALFAMGEGPGKDSKAARLVPRSRVCPLLAVAPRWDNARRGFGEFLRAGVELEDAYRTVVAYDDYGETAALGPAWRQRVTAVRRAYRLAQVDVREMRRALKVELGRELTARNCREELLLAAAATPELYRPSGGESGRKPTSGFVPRPPIDPAVATFYIDNRECPDSIDVYVDGAWLSEVPAHQRTALQARVGKRTICLLPQPSSATCGDQGTTREAYLHDRWSAVLHCPSDANQ